MKPPTKSGVQPNSFLDRKLIVATLAIAALGVLAACARPAPAPTATGALRPEELVFYNWEDYMPQSVLDDFTDEYGVRVTYLTYQSMEEAVRNIRTGQVVYDVAVVEHDNILALAADGLLAEIDYRHVPNFKHISADFRDLAFDPENRHLVPYNWGTTGLLVRGDLVDEPVTHWADLWDPRYAGRIAARPHQLELTAVALKSLGYSINSEDPVHVAAAGEQLLALKPSLVFVEVEAEQAVSRLISGEAVILVGWPGDALEAQSRNPAVRYVLPEEGAFLWGDGFVISARSPRKEAAELFLNFLLRPEISARIANEYYYATANEAAFPLINPDIRDNLAVFPPPADIQKAEWYLPRSPAGRALYDQVWQHFMSAAAQEKE